jgi:hypothetical protein
MFYLTWFTSLIYISKITIAKNNFHGLKRIGDYAIRIAPMRLHSEMKRRRNMKRIRIQLLLLSLAMMVIIPATTLIFAQRASAEQTGTFTGTWVASGKRQPFDFVKDRTVGTFNLSGNVSLKDEFDGIEDFWAECIGLSDSLAGSSVRCVWRSLKGEKAYSVLSGQPLKEGVKVTGQFVGGTGKLKGLTGTFTFTWTSTFTDKDQDMFTGHTQDLRGSYRIP